MFTELDSTAFWSSSDYHLIAHQRSYSSRHLAPWIIIIVIIINIIIIIIIIIIIRYLALIVCLQGDHDFLFFWLLFSFFCVKWENEFFVIRRIG